MKKVVSLLLILCLEFSLALPAAAFTDQKDVKYGEAVAIMTGIEVDD